MANRYMKRCSISLTVVQSLNHAKSLRPHRLQHAMLPCHSLSPGVFKFISIELMMPFNHLILCHPLLLPSILPSIRVFSGESALCIRWPEYWSFSISPSNEYFKIDWLDLLADKGLSRVFFNTSVQKHQFFCTQLSL